MFKASLDMIVFFIRYDSVEQIRRKEGPCKRAIFSFIFLLTD
jgi:hypothetical protein